MDVFSALFIATLYCFCVAALPSGGQSFSVVLLSLAGALDHFLACHLRLSLMFISMCCCRELYKRYRTIFNSAKPIMELSVILIGVSKSFRFPYYRNNFKAIEFHPSDRL